MIIIIATTITLITMPTITIIIIVVIIICNFGHVCVVSTVLGGVKVGCEFHISFRKSNFLPRANLEVHLNAALTGIFKILLKSITLFT